MRRTRQRIIRIALTLFAVRGPQAVSLRDTATHAGLTHGRLRHHPGSKEDIWRAVVAAPGLRAVIWVNGLSIGPQRLGGGSGTVVLASG